MVGVECIEIFSVCDSGLAVDVVLSTETGRQETSEELISLCSN